MTVTYPRSFGAKFHLVILVVIIGRFVSSSWSGWRFDEYDVTLRRAHHNITLTIVKIRFRIEHQQFRLVRNGFDSLHNLLVEHFENEENEEKIVHTEKKQIDLFVRLVDDIVTVNFDDTIRDFQSCCTGWRVWIHFTDKVTFVVF